MSHKHSQNIFSRINCTPSELRYNAYFKRAATYIKAELFA